VHLTYLDLLPSETALVIVDIQNDFCHAKGCFSKHKKVDLTYVHKAISTLLRFIEEMRRIDLPLIFVRTIHSTWTDSSSWLTRGNGKAEEMSICSPRSWGSQFFLIKPEDKDCVVTKHRYSAFFQTDLDLILRSRNIENLLVAGVLTNVCVESTVRDAFNRNYQPCLIADCCASYNSVEHEAAIRNIGKYFGKVSDMAEVLELLKNGYGNA